MHGHTDMLVHQYMHTLTVAHTHTHKCTHALIVTQPDQYTNTYIGIHATSKQTQLMHMHLHTQNTLTLAYTHYTHIHTLHTYTASGVE